MQSSLRWPLVWSVSRGPTLAGHSPLLHVSPPPLTHHMTYLLHLFTHHMSHPSTSTHQACNSTPSTTITTTTHTHTHCTSTHTKNTSAHLLPVHIQTHHAAPTPPSKLSAWLRRPLHHHTHTPYGGTWGHIPFSLLHHHPEDALVTLEGSYARVAMTPRDDNDWHANPRHCMKSSHSHWSSLSTRLAHNFSCIRL